MEESTYLVALAGLLRNVGKFAARAGEPGSQPWDDAARREFGSFPALLSADFIQEYVPADWRDQISSLTHAHQASGEHSMLALAVADMLAAAERGDLPGGDRATEPRQLRSIFCGIGKSGAPDAYWPLAELALDELALFPGQARDDDAAAQAYRDLWGKFKAEAQRLRDAQNTGGDLPTYVESLLLLMQRYTWCMPSASSSSPSDISLYDHGRMTAALAAVLVSSNSTAKQLAGCMERPEATAEPVALLVGGDVSGVQDFIYTITSKGATSSLRGRSFYLQLLTEASARFILRRLELPITNLIYAGGGNFYLLARPGDADRLRAVQGEISRVLLQHHRGDLYVAVAGRPLACADFFGGQISGAWGELIEALQRAKQTRFAELGADLALVFEPQGHGGSEDQQCKVCGDEYQMTAEDERKCQPCQSYETLGDQLRKACYLTWAEVEPVPADLGAPPGTWDRVLAGLGLQANVAREAGQLPRQSLRRRVILALNDDALRNLTPGPTTAIGRRFLVNTTPTITEAEIADLRSRGVEDLPDKEGIKSFSALEAQAHGIKRLGVLRMDVDNLGHLFSEGLGVRATLARVAGLSFAVSLYFEGWVEHLADQRNSADVQAGPGERLYAIYSGGDDLFFVGAWDAVVELAREIRIDLARYAAGNPEIHASGGIVLVGGKYPLYQAAQDSHHAEQQAKGLKWFVNDEQGEKDAISFLGQALAWRQFGLESCNQPGIGSAHALMHLLTGMTSREEGDGKEAPQALLRRLIRLYDQYEDAAKERRIRGVDLGRDKQPQVLWGPWMWLGFYTLSRMAKQTKNADITELKEKLKSDHFRSMEWIGLSARWAELATR